MLNPPLNACSFRSYNIAIAGAILRNHWLKLEVSLFNHTETATSELPTIFPNHMLYTSLESYTASSQDYLNYWLTSEVGHLYCLVNQMT